MQHYNDFNDKIDTQKYVIYIHFRKVLPGSQNYKHIYNNIPFFSNYILLWRMVETQA